MVGVHLNTAGTVSGVHAELDVALVTPGGVPGVLNEPVVLTVLSAVTDGKDGVIELGAALGAGKDTALVGLEDHLVGLDGNGKRLSVEGSLHLCRFARCDVYVCGHGGIASFSGAVLAAAFLAATRGVLVVRLLHGVEAGLVVFVGVVLKTTVAAHVAVFDSSAVNELLLREGEEFAGGNEVSALKRTSC